MISMTGYLNPRTLQRSKQATQAPVAALASNSEEEEQKFQGNKENDISYNSSNNNLLSKHQEYTQLKIPSQPKLPSLSSSVEHWIDSVKTLDSKISALIPPLGNNECWLFHVFMLTPLGPREFIRKRKSTDAGSGHQPLKAQKHVLAKTIRRSPRIAERGPSRSYREFLDPETMIEKELRRTHDEDFQVSDSSSISSSTEPACSSSASDTSEDESTTDNTKSVSQKDCDILAVDDERLGLDMLHVLPDVNLANSTGDGFRRDDLLFEVADGSEDLTAAGGQPFYQQSYVRAIPSNKAESFVHAAFRRLTRIVDKPLHEKQGTPYNIEENSTAVCLTKSLKSIGDDFYQRRCDYTGLNLSWSPGPQSVSFEAIYPFTKQKDCVGYHESQNLAMVSSTLNHMKFMNPVIALPLTSMWLQLRDCSTDNAYNPQEFMWVFNAMSNVCIMNKAFELRASHNAFATFISELKSPTVQSALLDSMRTGRLNEEARHLVEQYDAAALFSIPNLPSFPSPERQNRLGWDATYLYQQTLRIAQKYGLSKRDFEFFLTIPGPENRNRVFYPFHVLSQAQAIALGWDWHAWEIFTKTMLHRMRAACNKPAKSAGHGEPFVNEERFLFWLVSYFCERTSRDIMKLSDRSRGYIQLMMGDRFGLPLVPWTRHPFKASLCKGPTHGIAMKFGIIDTVDFDPVLHIDLKESTVEVDTVCTNFGMYNYSPDDWSFIRDSIKEIPMNTSFWKLDPTVGAKP